MAHWGSFALRTLAIALFVVYIAWNVFWLSHAKVPPSLFQTLTGLPCPTTGGTRSPAPDVPAELARIVAL